MVRGLLAGLCSGGAVAVVGLSALSVLVPLPDEAGPKAAPNGAATNGVDTQAVARGANGLSRSVPGPLAVPDPSPEADDSTAAPHPVSTEAPAPAPERVEVPQLPELAAPDVPQSDPLAAEPAVTRASPLWLSPAETSGKPVPAVHGGANMGGLMGGAADGRAPVGPDLTMAPTMTGGRAAMPGEDGAPSAPGIDTAKTRSLADAPANFAPPAPPVSVDAATGVAATDTSTASRPDPLALPVIPAAGAVTVGDALRVIPAAEGIIPVPPPGDATAPALAPVAAGGAIVSGAHRPDAQTSAVQDIVVVPRKPMEFGPLRQPMGSAPSQTN